GPARSYICALYRSPYKGQLEVQFKDLVAAVVDALPAGWIRTADAPFSGVVDSAGFSATDGTNGQIWVVFVPEQNDYSLNFQIVTTNAANAAPAPAAEKPADDDPIGEGG